MLSSLLLPALLALPQGQSASTGATTPTVSDVRIIRIGTLDPGALHEAVATPGKRIVQFDVGGTIDLEGRRVLVEEPGLILDGSTAPFPGITLVRGGISIRTNDVEVRHLRVRPGDAGELPGSGWEPDGIGIWGPDAYDILVENCSISWAVDENVAVSSLTPPDDAPQRVTFRYCIISEALDNSTHSEGAHSRGALIRGKDVTVEGCLFAHNARRNPVFRDGATGKILNNVIYNPRSAAIHFDRGSAVVIGNLLIPGPDTTEPNLAKGRGWVIAKHNYTLASTGQFEPARIDSRLFKHQSDAIGPTNQNVDVDAILSPEELLTYVATSIGARPDIRDEVDLRILLSLLHRNGQIIDSQSQVGGY